MSEMNCHVGMDFNFFFKLYTNLCHPHLEMYPPLLIGVIRFVIVSFPFCNRKTVLLAELSMVDQESSLFLFEWCTSRESC